MSDENTLFSILNQSMLDAMRQARSALRLALAECPRGAFVLGFKPDTAGRHWFLCSSSLGYYFGSVFNALPLFQPLPDINLNGARLPGGEIPEPDMMLMKHAINLQLEQINSVIKDLEEEIKS